MTTIRKATPQDVAAILELIKELAVFEKLAHEVVATQELLLHELFRVNREGSTKVLIIEVDCDAGSNTTPLYYVSETRCIAGFALYFCNFSTFLGRHGIYLEDLYVREQFRLKGIGKQVFKELARIALECNFGRIEWSVLNWNVKAIKFYEGVGAFPMSEWTQYRLTGQNLIDFAKDK